MRNQKPMAKICNQNFGFVFKNQNSRFGVKNQFFGLKDDN